MQITPAILASDEADCKAKLFLPEFEGVVPRFHIDVLNNTLVYERCWADPEIIGSWKNLPEIEVHLMVNHPSRVAATWKAKVPTLKNVIVHIESVHDPIKTCEKLKVMGLTATIAVNPRTPVEAVNDMRGCADELLIMGVEPGASGQSFLGEVILAKIRRARALFKDLPIAIDGGVSKKSIHALKEAGVTRFIAASAIWKSPTPLEELQELQSML